MWQFSLAGLSKNPWVFIESLNIYLGLGTLKISWCKKVRAGVHRKKCSWSKELQSVSDGGARGPQLPKSAPCDSGTSPECVRPCHRVEDSLSLPSASHTVVWYREKTRCSGELLLSEDAVCLLFALTTVVDPFSLLTWETLFEKHVYIKKTFFHRNKRERIKWESTTKMSSYSPVMRIF